MITWYQSSALILAAVLMTAVDAMHGSGGGISRTVARRPGSKLAVRVSSDESLTADGGGSSASTTPHHPRRLSLFGQPAPLSMDSFRGASYDSLLDAGSGDGLMGSSPLIAAPVMDVNQHGGRIVNSQSDSALNNMRNTRKTSLDRLSVHGSMGGRRSSLGRSSGASLTSGVPDGGDQWLMEDEAALEEFPLEIAETSSKGNNLMETVLHENELEGEPEDVLEALDQLALESKIDPRIGRHSRQRGENFSPLESTQSVEIPRFSRPELLIDSVSGGSSMPRSSQFLDQRERQEKEQRRRILESYMRKQQQADSMPPNVLREPLAQLRQQLMDKESIRWLVDGAFFEVNWKIPFLAEMQKLKNENENENKYENLERLGALNTVKVEQSIKTALDDLAQRIDIVPVQMFKNLLNQFIFYHNIFSMMHVNHALIGVDVWSLHLQVPSLSFCVLSVGFMNRVIEAVNLLSKKGIKNPTLEFTAKYDVVDSSEAESEPVLTNEPMKEEPVDEEDLMFEIAEEEKGADHTDRDDFQKKKKSELPKKFTEVQTVLGDAENAGTVLSTVDEVATEVTHHHIKIGTDVQLDFINSVNGIVSIADKYSPDARNVLKKTKAPLLIAGANLALNFAKVAMHPAIMRKEHEMMMVITVKALDLIEEWRKQNEEQPSTSEPENTLERDADTYRKQI